MAKKSSPLLYPPKIFSQPHLNAESLEQKRIIRPNNLIKKISEVNPDNPRLKDIKADEKTIEELTRLPDATGLSPKTKKTIDMSSPKHAFTLLATPIRTEESSYHSPTHSFTESQTSSPTSANTSPRSSSSGMSSSSKKPYSSRVDAYLQTRRPKLPVEITECLDKMARITVSEKKVASKEMLDTMRELENIVASKQHLLGKLMKDEEKVIAFVCDLSLSYNRMSNTVAAIDEHALWYH
jgi:hypothetical protein